MFFLISFRSFATDLLHFLWLRSEFSLLIYMHGGIETQLNFRIDMCSFSVCAFYENAWRSMFFMDFAIICR